MIWKVKPELEVLNSVSLDNMPAFLGIEFTEVGEDYIKAKMPVNERTKQPFGLLHGGASVVLAETLGSSASFLLVDPTTQAAVGLSINANHLRSATSGFVHATARPVKIGRTIHVWQIDIEDDNQKAICSSRLTVSVINRAPRS